MMNEKLAEENTFCHYCGEDISEGESYHEVVALLPKKCCRTCYESDIICRRLAQSECEHEDM